MPLNPNPLTESVYREGYGRSRGGGGGCGEQKAGKEEEKGGRGKKGGGERVDNRYIGGQRTEWVASYVQWMDR